jgi:hypothetical protein
VSLWKGGNYLEISVRLDDLGFMKGIYDTCKDMPDEAKKAMLYMMHGAAVARPVYEAEVAAKGLTRRKRGEKPKQK